MSFTHCLEFSIIYIGSNNFLDGPNLYIYVMLLVFFQPVSDPPWMGAAGVVEWSVGREGLQVVHPGASYQVASWTVASWDA